MSEPLASLRRRTRLLYPFPVAYSATEPVVAEALGLVLDFGPPMSEVALQSPVPL
jgi:hypothetical protein